MSSVCKWVRVSTEAIARNGYRSTERAAVTVMTSHSNGRGENLELQRYPPPPPGLKPPEA